MRTESVRRRWLVAGAVVCAIVVAVLAIVVHSRSASFQDFDTDVGSPAEAWSYHHPVAVRMLVGIEIAFGTVATVAYVLVLLAVLWVTGRRRAVGWATAVIVGASITTNVLKLSFRRLRPQWADPVHALTTFSFPSGHASGIASGMGVVAVLTLVYVRAAAVRRALLALAAVLVVVGGADRILLGVHNLSDVVAGYAVGAFWVLTMLAVYPPKSMVARSRVRRRLLT